MVLQLLQWEPRLLSSLEEVARQQREEWELLVGFERDAGLPVDDDP